MSGDAKAEWFNRRSSGSGVYPGGCLPCNFEAVDITICSTVSNQAGLTFHQVLSSLL